MKRITSSIIFVFLSVVLYGQSEYYLTLPEIQHKFRKFRTFTLVMKNNGPPANIQYEWMNAGGTNTFNSSPGPILTGSVSRVNLSFPTVGGWQFLNCVSFPFVYHNDLTPDFGGVGNGLLHIFSTTANADFEVYFELTHGSYDEIITIKGIPSMASAGDTVLVPAQTLHPTIFDNSNVDTTCQDVTYQAVFLGNPDPLNNAIIQAHTNNNGIIFNGTPIPPNSPITILIPPLQTVTLHSGTTNNAFHIGGTWFEVQSGQVTSTFLDGPVLVQGSGYDPSGDNLPTTDFLGKNYFLRSGISTNGQEAIMIQPKSDNTTYTVRRQGSPTLPPFTRDRGQQETIPLLPNESVMIFSDKDLLVYQTSGIDKEIGGSVVPNFGCNGSSETYMIRPSSTGINDVLILTLFCLRPYRNNFTIESSGLINSSWSWYSESDAWTEITDSLSLNWEEHTNTCASSSTNPSRFYSCSIVVPRSLVPPNTAIKVSNDIGVFHMGMLFNANGKTCKFAYLSAYDSIPADTCVFMKEEFCQYEDPCFNVCTNFQYTHHKIIVKDDSGNLIGSTPVLDYPANQRDFCLREMAPNFPDPGNTGCFEMSHITYYSTDICGVKDTCRQDTVVRDFCIVTDIDTTWTIGEHLEFCDWSSYFNPNLNDQCAETTCQMDNIATSMLTTAGNFPAMVLPSSGSMADGSAVWCLVPGEYNRYCYDTLHCQTIATPITVTSKFPSPTLMMETLSFCDWSTTINPEPWDDCAEYRACSYDGISYVGLNSSGNFPVSLLPESGDVNNPVQDPPVWCLEPGTYQAFCYDTLVCEIKYIDIIVNAIPAGGSLGAPITALYCDWSGILGPSFFITCLEFTDCDNSRLTHTSISTNNGIPNFVDPVSGDWSDPSTNPIWCLEPGSYIRRCFMDDCSWLETEINVVANIPGGIAHEPTNQYICDWGLLPPTTTLERIEGCQNLGNLDSKLFSTFIPSEITPTGNNSGIPYWDLDVGTYILECYEDCIIHQYTVIIETQTPNTVFAESNEKYCGSDGCFEYYGCNEVGITIATMMQLSPNVAPLPPTSGSIDPYGTPTWCLGTGTYQISCYSEIDCTIYNTTIRVTQDQEVYEGTTSSKSSCDDIVEIGELDNSNSSEYYLYLLPDTETVIDENGTGVFSVAVIGLSARYGIKYIDEDGCWRMNTIDITCDDPCIMEIGLDDYFYDRTYFPVSEEALHTMSTTQFKNNFYSVMNNKTLKNSIVLRVTNAKGYKVASKEYVLNEDELGFFAKEIQVIEEGIFIIANTENVSPSKNTHGDNSSAKNDVQAILMKINKNNLSVDWVKSYVFDNTITKHPDHEKKVFFNSFVPKLDTNNKLTGFIAVGAARDRFEPHTVSQIDLYPLICSIDPDGAAVNSIKLNSSINFTTPDSLYREESAWAMDITTSTGNKDLKYAVLLQSRSHFNGIVGHHNRAPGALLPVIRSSYLFVDDDLNINKNIPNGLNLKWDSHTNARLEANIPKKIEFDNSGSSLMVYVTGQVWNVDQDGFLNIDEGFLYKYNNSPGISIQNLVDNKYYNTIGGYVDLLVNQGEIKLVGKDHIDELNFTNLTVTNSHYLDHTVAHETDFHIWNNYNGELIFNHPVSGILVSDTRNQSLVKFAQDYSQKCPNDGPVIEAYYEHITSINNSVKLIPEEYSDIAFDWTKEPFAFDVLCCMEGGGLGDPCAYEIDVIFEKDCNGLISVLEIQITPEDPVFEYSWAFNDLTSQDQFPNFQMDADGQLVLKLDFENGCTETWISDHLTQTDTLAGETFTVVTEFCFESVVTIGREIPGVDDYYLVGTFPISSNNSTGFFDVEGAPEGGSVEYKIYYQDGDGCWKVDTYVLTCLCNPDPDADVYENWVIEVEDPEQEFTLEIPQCPEGCGTTYEITGHIPFVGSVDLSGNYLDPGNPDLMTLTPIYSVVHVRCYDDDGCVCYSALYNLSYPYLPAKRRKINEVKDLNVGIYPNPTTSTFQIEIDADRIDNAKIFDIKGKLIQEYINVAASTIFSMENRPSGVYIISVVVGNSIQQKKLIVH